MFTNNAFLPKPCLENKFGILLNIDMNQEGRKWKLLLSYLFKLKSFDYSIISYEIILILSLFEI